MAQIISEIHSNWSHFFGNLQFSSNDFYKSVEDSLDQQDIPKISVKRVNLSEGGLFSSNREYLRVKRGPYIFDICAAPYGKGFFVSWWFGEEVSFFRAMLLKIPVLNVLIARTRTFKTYFQVDTFTMFKTCVHDSVTASLDTITNVKGVRGLSDVDRKYTDKRSQE